jgi:cytochrome bd-type quinol oxidase subunit 2
MEEKIMMIKIVGLLIGILVLGMGLYYRNKEKSDPESKKIYTVVSGIGGVVALICLLVLVL